MDELFDDVWVALAGFVEEPWNHQKFDTYEEGCDVHGEEYA